MATLHETSPPAYLQSPLTTSVLDAHGHDDFAKPGPSVPRAIALRCTQPKRIASEGSLKIHVPAWGVSLVRPSSPHVAADANPGEDTMISGSLEVIMKQRRRCRRISVAVQSICNVWMGEERGFVEDGIFERVVDIFSCKGEEGIWLEAGSQSFAFTIALPATLATHDCHTYGTLQYFFVAHVQGGTPSVSLGRLWTGLFGTREQSDWLDGDLWTRRNMLVHAVTSPDGRVHELDLRREAVTSGLGPWTFYVLSELWAISGVFMLDVSFPSPPPRTTIFLVRLLLVQSYTVSSPRAPDLPPTSPEKPRMIELFEIGRQHAPGEKNPDHSVDSLWRGPEAGGQGDSEGWETRTLIRLPSHEIIRPSTHSGTITPIRVQHNFELQVFHSVEDEQADGTPCEGPGGLRMMSVRTGVMVPSCCCTISSLDLPPYTKSDAAGLKEFDQLFQTPAALLGCMCGGTYEELSKPMLRRMEEMDRAESVTTSTAGGDGHEHRQGGGKSSLE